MSLRAVENRRMPNLGGKKDVPLWESVHCLPEPRSPTIRVVAADCGALGCQQAIISLLMSTDPVPPSPSSRPSANLDREESQLWQWALWFMILLSVALAGLLWERLE